MRPYTRWIWQGGLALCACSLAVILLYLLVPADRVARLLMERVAFVSGQPLTIAGPVRPKFWPSLTVAAQDITLGAEGSPVLHAQSLEVRLNMAALWGGDVEIRSLDLVAPQILVTREQTAGIDWGGLFSLGLNHIGLHGATIRYLDGAAGQDVSLNDLELNLDAGRANGLVSLIAKGRLAGDDVWLEAEAADFATLIRGDLVGVAAKLNLGPSRILFKGHAGYAPAIGRGVIEVDLALPSALAWLGQGVNLPKGLGRDRLRLGGDISYSPDGILSLRKAKIEADHNVIFGELDLSWKNPRPKLSGNLRAQTLDFRAPLGQAARSTGWSEAKIDLKGALAWDGEVSLASQGINIAGFQLGQSRMFIVLDRARAVFDLRDVAAYGGTITGEFVVNGRSGLSVGGKLSLENMRLGALFSDVLGANGIQAGLNAQLTFLGVGDSVAAIMHSLSGEGRLRLTGGNIQGVDLEGLLRRLDLGYIGKGQATGFDAVTASFVMADGQVQTTDLEWLASYGKLSGVGRLGLGAQDQDLMLRPLRFSDTSGAGILVPVRIRDTWFAPSYTLELEAMAREIMAIEKGAP